MIRSKENELSRVQKIYRDFANAKSLTFKDKNERDRINKKIQLTSTELDTLNIRLSVAQNKVHQKHSDDCMNKLAANIIDMERLTNAILSGQSDVNHLKSQIGRVEAEQRKLDRHAIADNQYADKLLHTRKTVDMLERQLNTSRQKENKIKINNSQLQKMASELTNDRYQFNRLWKSIIHRLNFDKKMLIDMVDQVVMAFDNGTEICKRIDFIRKKATFDKRTQIDEMTELVRFTESDERAQHFFQNKANKICSKELDQKETTRRNNFKNYHKEIMETYKKTIGDINRFSAESKLDAIIAKFKKHKREYFSYCMYLNNINHNITHLGQTIDKLQNDIQSAESSIEHHRYQNRQDIEVPKSILLEKCSVNRRKDEQFNEAQLELQKYFHKIDLIFTTLKCNDTSLVKEFENETANSRNFDVYLAAIDNRLKQIISFVYYHERKTKIYSNELTIKDVEVLNCRINDEPIPSIVHQCAECAEAEDTGNPDIELPLATDALRKKIIKKLMEPEIQFRMHSIDQCQKPVSRALLAKSL